MKNLIVLSILILAVAASVQAAEPVSGNLSFTAGAGINMPSEDGAKNGYIVGAGLGFHATDKLVLGADIAYLGYGNETGSLDSSSDFSFSQRFINYAGSARYYVSGGKASPYFKGFVGRYNYSFDTNFGGIEFDDGFSDLMYGGGFGMTLRGDRESNFYIEALYNQLQADEDSATIYTITVGMDLTIGL
jgi:opacity protein-like surface antigen